MRTAVAIASLAVLCSTALAQTPGKIVEVCVYQGQALVTREVPFEAKGGPQEVIVTELPEQIVPESLYGIGGEKLAIRAVRFRATAVAEEPRPEVKALDEDIKKNQRDQQRIAGELGTLDARSKYLDNIEAFAADRAQDEVRKGTLRPTVLQDTTKFLIEQRDEIAKKRLELKTQTEDLQEALSVLQRRRAELTAGAARNLREAVVFVDAAAAGPATVKLSYLVTGVGWAPAYSARLNETRDKVALEYHAVLTQMSGENWPDVVLTLSTSHPRMIASAPLLSPLRISLVPAGAEQMEKQQANAETYQAARRDIQQQMRSPRAKAPAGPRAPMGDKGDLGAMGPGGGMGGGMGMGGPSIPGGYGMPSAEQESVESNLLAARLQNMELTAPDEVVKLSRVSGAVATEGLAVDYAIPGRISIESRRDQQMFHIATLDLAATFNYTAVPLLSDYVYQAVECVNTSEYPLLPGPYNAYLGTAFAGRGDLPLVARGQNLTLGFGTETQLRASRELEDKTTTVRGGNNVVSYTYRIRLNNYMDKPAKVRVWDRLPQAPDKQVTITLTQPNPPLSEDTLYTSQQKPRGLLRWDVEVPANASAGKAFSFTYQFQTEYDKNYTIGELPAGTAEAMRKDLEVMQRIQAGAGAMAQ